MSKFDLYPFLLLSLYEQSVSNVNAINICKTVLLIENSFQRQRQKEVPLKSIKCITLCWQENTNWAFLTQARIFNTYKSKSWVKNGKWTEFLKGFVWSFCVVGKFVSIHLKCTFRYHIIPIRYLRKAELTEVVVRGVWCEFKVLEIAYIRLK